MPFEPGQLTRESERITKERLEQARVELASEAGAIGDGEFGAGEILARRSRDDLEPRRRCPDCGAKLTVQVLPHGYEAVCTPCERRARFDAAAE